MPRIWHDVNIPSSTVPADGPLPPLLPWFLGAEVAEDPPVGEAEGVGHGVADVGLGGEGMYRVTQSKCPYFEEL